jgi:hypothetical protein
MPCHRSFGRPFVRSSAAALVAFAVVFAGCSDLGAVGTATPPPASGAAACPAIPPPNPDPAGWPAPGVSVTPVLITSPVVCGPNRFLFSFIDADNRPAATPARSASVAIYELGRDADTPIATVQGEFVWGIEDFSGVYVTNLTFPSSGRYGAEYVTATAGGPSETIRMTFDVQPDSPVVGVGDQAPASKTPTLSDVDGDVSRISTDDDPNPAFYETSVDEALADHEPFVLIFATPKFCKQAQCGPTLDRTKPFAERYPTVTFINVEPYKLEYVDGSLEADLDANDQLQPVPAVGEWGLLFEPVVYVVDRQGIVQGRFDLIFGDGELSAALDEVK